MPAVVMTKPQVQEQIFLALIHPPVSGEPLVKDPEQAQEIASGLVDELKKRGLLVSFIDG
jgi:hypothetical protein